MRVHVTGEEKELEDQHAGGPDGRGATEPGEDVLADDELDLKKEKGAEEDGGGEDPDGRFSRNWSGGFSQLFGGFDQDAHAEFYLKGNVPSFCNGLRKCGMGGRRGKVHASQALGDEMKGSPEIAAT